MFALRPGLFEISARRFLERIHQTHGAPVRRAAEQTPGLIAEMDQHGAAIRDILELGIENATRIAPMILLAGYVRGLLAEATEPLAAPEDWTVAGWLDMRLAAVCMLADTAAEHRPAR